MFKIYHNKSLLISAFNTKKNIYHNFALKICTDITTSKMKLIDDTYLVQIDKFRTSIIYAVIDIIRDSP